MDAQNYFKYKISLEKIIKKKPKLILFFLQNPVLFNEQDYEKQKRPATSDQLLFKLQKSSNNCAVLVMYYLTKFDDVI